MWSYIPSGEHKKKWEEKITITVRNYWIRSEFEIKMFPDFSVHLARRVLQLEKTNTSLRKENQEYKNKINSMVKEVMI